MHEIVGRDEELGFIEAFLARPAGGPAGLVLEGAAGIGKSTLWSVGVAAARARFRVLSSRPGEVEQGLPNVALSDLLEGVLDEVRPALSAPRRRALEAALLVEEASQPVDPRTLAAAVRSALEVLAAEGPIVLAVDDVQWLDPSSESALAFALRRLDDASVLLLLARRLGDEATPSALVDALESDRMSRMDVRPLSVGATHRLVQLRLGRTLRRPTLLRLHETSGGNPFYALELARLVRAEVDPMQPLRVPDTLESLVRRRLDRLPKRTRRALMHVSALAQASREVLKAAGISEEELEPAVAAHVLEVEDDSIRFTHPLLASVTYQHLSVVERRRVHTRLAAVVADPIARARHLALAAEGADAGVAAVLEDASAEATVRGAAPVAAELAEFALRLTPVAAEDDHCRRTITAARAHLACGDGHHAERLVRGLLAAVGLPDSARVEALVLLGEFEARSYDFARAIELLREAVSLSTDAAVQCSIHAWLARLVWTTAGLPAARQHAHSALTLAEQIDDDSVRARALAAAAIVHSLAGEPDALALARNAHRLSPAVSYASHIDFESEPSFSLACVLVWSGRHDEARPLLEDLERELSERNELMGSVVLTSLSIVELRAGRLSLAADYGERAHAIFVDYGVDADGDSPASVWLALAGAYRGDLDAAREIGERYGSFLERRRISPQDAVAVAGVSYFWRGHLREARARLASAEQAASAVGAREPMRYWWRAEYVDCLLELDQIDETAALLDTWEADAAPLGREWVLAQVTRGRGLIAAARGDVAAALPLLEQAVLQHEEVGDTYGRARALLGLGIIRRRARQKRAAREAIEAAISEFEAIGAAGWAEKGRSELARVGGRTRVRGFTPAERRVAELAAAGKTNREVAAALFLSERTVEGHLSHIYAKLGIRSRTELARTLR